MPSAASEHLVICPAAYSLPCHSSNPLVCLPPQQFIDAPASMEGAASGVLDSYVEPPEPPSTHAVRWLMRALHVELNAKIMLPRLRRSRIWHCYCATESTPTACPRTTCHPVGPPSTAWNGIAYQPPPSASAGKPVHEGGRRARAGGDEGGGALGEGRLYVADIFRRLVVEFGTSSTGSKHVELRQRRVYRAPFMVDNVHVDAPGERLWMGMQVSIRHLACGHDIDSHV